MVRVEVFCGGIRWVKVGGVGEGGLGNIWVFYLGIVCIVLV